MRLSPLQATLLASGLMILVSAVLPTQFKHWFVEDSGNFRMLTGIGPLLAIGLLLRFRVLVLSAIMYGFGAVFCAYLAITADAAFQAGFVLMSILQIILLVLLFSAPVRAYLDRGSAPLES